MTFIEHVSWELLSSCVLLTFYSSLKTVWPKLKTSKCSVLMQLKSGERMVRKTMRGEKRQKGRVRSRKLEYRFRMVFKPVLPLYETACVMCWQKKERLKKTFRQTDSHQPANHPPMARGQLVGGFTHPHKTSHTPTPKIPKIHLSSPSYLHLNTSLFHIRLAVHWSMSPRTSRLSPCSP